MIDDLRTLDPFDAGPSDPRIPWPMFAVGSALWAVALVATAVVVAVDRIANRFLTGGN